MAGTDVEAGEASDSTERRSSISSQSSPSEANDVTAQAPNQDNARANGAAATSVNVSSVSAVNDATDSSHTPHTPSLSARRRRAMLLEEIEQYRQLLRTLQEQGEDVADDHIEVRDGDNVVGAEPASLRLESREIRYLDDDPAVGFVLEEPVSGRFEDSLSPNAHGEVPATQDHGRLQTSESNAAPHDNQGPESSLPRQRVTTRSQKRKEAAQHDVGTNGTEHLPSSRAPAGKAEDAEPATSSDGHQWTFEAVEDEALPALPYGMHLHLHQAITRQWVSCRRQLRDRGYEGYTEGQLPTPVAALIARGVWHRMQTVFENTLTMTNYCGNTKDGLHDKSCATRGRNCASRASKGFLGDWSTVMRAASLSNTGLSASARSSIEQRLSSTFGEERWRHRTPHKPPQTPAERRQPEKRRPKYRAARRRRLKRKLHEDLMEDKASVPALNTRSSKRAKRSSLRSAAAKARQSLQAGSTGWKKLDDDGHYDHFDDTDDMDADADTDTSFVISDISDTDDDDDDDEGPGKA